MSDNSLSNQEFKNLTDLSIHLGSEAIPQQMMINKSIEGRFQSVSTPPIGQDSNFGKDGNTSLKFRISNGDMVDLSSACICGQVEIKVPADGVFPTNVNFTGMHTAFESVSVYMKNKPFINVKRGSDRVADLSLKYQSTTEQLAKYNATMLYKHEASKNKVYSFRVPLKLWGNIQNILPTNALTSSIDVELDINTDINKLLYTGTTALTAGTTITMNKMTLQADYIRVNKPLMDRYMNLIRSSSGLSIPFHTYALDIRSIRAGGTNYTEYIPTNYENMLFLVQLAYPVASKAVNNGRSYYDDLKFTENGTIEEISEFLVNFDSSQYFNLNGNKSQSGKASHAEALDRIIQTYEDNDLSSGGNVINNINSQQALAVSFLRSQETKSAYVTNGGINGRLLNGQVTTSAELGSDILATNTLNTLIKYTRKIIFRDGNLDVTN